MMIKIKDIYKKEKNVFLNIFSLLSINFFRFFINILTLPHLIKIYGPTSWGEITILQIFINYFIWITDWSLDQQMVDTRGRSESTHESLKHWI